jgi:hypothetical protein
LVTLDGVLGLVLGTPDMEGAEIPLAVHQQCEAVGKLFEQFLRIVGVTSAQDYWELAGVISDFGIGVEQCFHNAYLLVLIRCPIVSPDSPPCRDTVVGIHLIERSAVVELRIPGLSPRASSFHSVKQETSQEIPGRLRAGR